jgi:protein-tyrosine-phosphatase
MTMAHGAKLTTEQILLVKQATQRLKSDFAGMFSAETIERFITESQEDLESRARITTWMPVLIERFARDRLRALARVEGLVVDTRPMVLFLCVQNAGRSQMAAGWLRHLAGDAVEVFSGGSEPASDVNQGVIAAMAEMGIDISTEFPRPWTDEVVRAADVVVTMGCGDACPVYPGKRYEGWELADPAGQPIELVRDVRDGIEQRVRRLMAELHVAARV